MADFKKFITDHTKADFRGMNWITYKDGGVEMYISFQVLLKFISENLNLFSSSNPVVNIDWQSDKPFYALSCHISTDLTVCYLYNERLKIEDGSNPNPNLATFHPFYFFTDDTLKVLNSNLRNESGATSEDYVYPQVGNINYIYLNVGYLSQIIADNLDKENKITLRTFLQTICDDVNKSLGGINDFQVTINADETPNTLTIVDFNQSRIKGLTNTISSSPQYTVIQAHGVGIDNGGQATFVKNIQAQSNITPEIASSISIGAQANGNQIGEEATSFSRLSKGLIDRIYPEKHIVNSSTDATLPLVNRYSQNIESFKTLISNLQKNKDPKSAEIYIKLSDENNNGPIISDLFKAIVGEFTEKNISNPTFIPIKLELELLGISGIRIFEQFELSSDVLPLSYQKDFNFIITGVSHEIDTHKWTTKLSALTYLKEIPVSASTEIKAIDLKLTEATTNFPVSNSPGVCRTKLLNQNTITAKPYSLSQTQNDRFRGAWNQMFKGKDNSNTVKGAITSKVGLCAQGVYTIATFSKAYIERIQSYSGRVNNTGENGHANQNGYWNKLSGGGANLDYERVLIGNGLTKSEITNAIASLEFYMNLGDILVYFSEDSTNTADGQFGHTQIFVGDLTPSKFSCDLKNNYGTRFVYNNKTTYPSECYTLYLFRVPKY
jgi:hypothetical protein